MKKWLMVLVGLTLAALLVIGSLACGSDTPEGAVDHKTITGITEGAARTVLINRLNDQGLPFTVVKAQELLSHFSPDDEHLVIGDTLAFEIESWYDLVDYLVNIKLASSTETGT